MGVRIAFCIATLLLLLNFTSVVMAVPIYSAGHADIGVDYLPGPPRFDLKIRFDGNSEFEDGSVFSFQRVSPSSVAIRAPDPSILRENHIGDPDDPDDDYDNSGPEWDFLGTSLGAPIWFIPQTNDPTKPFFGFATDNLDIPQWSGPLTWSLEAVVSAPAGGEVSLWQSGFFGNPTVKYASYDGIDPEGDSFTQGVGGHDHFNWGFTKPGVYEVQLGASGTRIGVGPVHGSGVFTFLVGDAAGAAQDGDFDGDSDVDGNDFLKWQRGESPIPLSATDLALWRANFGQPGVTTAQASGTAIPEPSTLVLVVTVFSALAVQHRKSLSSAC